MTTPQQIDANRENSQLSTGPTSEEGKHRSSLNATKHGFTGQTLNLSANEKEAYEAHVKAYLADYSPDTHAETQLVHQLADLHWSIHQISVQQCNMIALMDAVGVQLAAAGDAVATAAALTPLVKNLGTLNLYEQRRRRTADAIELRLNALLAAKEEERKEQLTLAAKFYQLKKSQGETWNPADFGFDCSLADIEAFLEGQTIAAATVNSKNGPKPAWS